VSTTADHIVPWKLAPALRYVRSNLHGSCEPCSRARGDTSVRDLPAPRAALAADARAGRGGRVTPAPVVDPPALSWFDTKDVGRQRK
jgi:hypothetical protein